MPSLSVIWSSRVSPVRVTTGTGETPVPDGTAAATVDGVSPAIHRHGAPAPGLPEPRPQLSTSPSTGRGQQATGPTLPVVPSDAQRSERGSTLPLVLVCWLVAALMAFGAIAASDAFLEQQEVQAVCDGAALAAANATDEPALYATGLGTALPLTAASTRAAVADHLADGGSTLDAWSTETDGVEVTVHCTRQVEIAFGWLFLGGQPLNRTAVASARAPTLS